MGVLCLICIIHKMTPQTETAHIRSRRYIKIYCGVSPHRFTTATVSKKLGHTFIKNIVPVPIFTPFSPFLQNQQGEIFIDLINGNSL